ncbi:sensor histidine kinase [Caballeronia mineralivorans]|uniref:sensor histidine kinase n=1 Tax=Caballeronia mineralivorans TaxID=2010198 RepID=UPI0007C76ED8|nr:sensor histidine kinase [Caballeronia mineralivorans]
MTNTPVGPLQRLAATLRDQRDVLTNRWIKSALRDADIGHCHVLTYEQLADHVPVILDEICYFLESEHLSDVEVAIERDARTHGHWRWKQGYRLDELIRELDLFRRVLTAAIANFAEDNHDFTRSHETHARDLVDDAVNLVMLASVRQLVGEQERKVGEYTGMLEEANRGLASQRELLADIYQARQLAARSVVHELRNFLNVFETSLELVRARPAKVDTALTVASRQIADMKLLVDQLFEYSVVLSENQVPVVERFELRALYDELVLAHRVGAEAKGLHLRSEFDSSLDFVTLNRLRVKQIAVNLISNAMKYTRSGEVGFALVKLGADRWCLRVSDTGEGISLEDQERVFGELERAAGADIPGAGLGLAIVKELVWSLSGEIWVVSEKGKGSVFEIRLPLHLPQQSGSDESPSVASCQNRAVSRVEVAGEHTLSSSCVLLLKRSHDLSGEI